MPVKCAVCDTDNDKTASCSFCGTPLAPAPGMSGVLPIGTRLHGGTFSVGRVLGAGGFGITYLAVDLRLHRLVAIKEFFPFGSLRSGAKVIHGPNLSDPIFIAARDRFLHEARVAAQFQHPGIVHVYTFFEENETAYMVMELLQGETLYDSIERNGPLDEETAVAYIEQVASALKAVHTAGFIHRDLKPENIFVTRDGRVVLLDFGTAKEMVRKQVTAMVSPGYAPPEQYLAEYTPDPRSDVYALAATLYHLLTGTLPVEAPQRSAGTVLVAPTTLNPRISPRVGSAIQAGMALDPAQRPAGITAFVDQLRARTIAPSGPGDAPRAPHLSPSLPYTVSEAPDRTANRLQPPAPRFDARPADPHPDDQAAEVPPPILKYAAMMRGHNGYVRSVDFTPDSEWLVSGSEDKTARLWGVRSHEEHARLKDHDGWISCVRVAPTGQVLATACHDKKIRLWDIERRRVVCAMQGGAAALSVAFSPDGTRLAASFIDGVVILWDRDGTERGRTPTVKESIWNVAFSPDGTLLAFGTWTNPYVQLWDVARWREAGRIAGHSSGIRSLAWNPRGDAIATSSKDAVIRIWDVATRKESMHLDGHRGRVNAVTFHPSGDFLVSAGADKTIRIWDRAGRLAQVVEAHGGEVLSVSFSSNGRFLASGSQDERVGLFTMER